MITELYVSYQNRRPGGARAPVAYGSVASLTPMERRRLGLAVLTAYVGPVERRAADITAVAGEHDPREVLFGVLSVARDLLGVLEAEQGVSATEVLQALAGRDAGAEG